MKIYSTKDLILMNSVQVYKGRTVSQHLYNEGLNKDSLEKEKQHLLSILLRDQDNLINVTEHYPENDIQDIDLEIDLVIIKREELDKIFDIKEFYNEKA